MNREDFNIMSSIRIIENLKAELLCIIGDFFKLLARGSNIAQDAILECISGAIIILYILGESLGYSYEEVDEKMKNKLKIGIAEGDIIEKETKNLSKLHSHLNSKR